MKKMMNSFFRLGVIMLLLAIILPAEAQVVVVKKPKKPTVLVVQKDKPGPDYVWIEGHWYWDKGAKKYAWKRGHWVKKRDGSRFMPGKWKKVPTGWKWVPGTWVTVKKHARVEKIHKVKEPQVLVVDKIAVEGGIVAKRPIRPRVKVRKGKQPGPDYVWRPGCWRWNTDTRKYVWVHGKWVRQPGGMKWVPGKWKSVPGGYKWIPGRWRKK